LNKIFYFKVCTKKAFYYDPKTDFGQLISFVGIDEIKIYSIYSFNNQLYLIGGYFGHNIRHHIVLYKYNPQTNTWIRVFLSPFEARAPGNAT